MNKILFLILIAVVASTVHGQTLQPSHVSDNAQISGVNKSTDGNKSCAPSYVWPSFSVSGAKRVKYIPTSLEEPLKALRKDSSEDEVRTINATHFRICENGNLIECTSVAYNVGVRVPLSNSLANEIVTRGEGLLEDYFQNFLHQRFDRTYDEADQISGELAQVVYIGEFLAKLLRDDNKLKLWSFVAGQFHEFGININGSVGEPRYDLAARSYKLSGQEDLYRTSLLRAANQAKSYYVSGIGRCPAGSAEILGVVLKTYKEAGIEPPGYLK